MLGAERWFGLVTFPREVLPVAVEGLFLKALAESEQAAEERLSETFESPDPCADTEAEPRFATEAGEFAPCPGDTRSCKYPLELCDFSDKPFTGLFISFGF